MDWLLANWFWILIFVLFIAMHMFGHGCHGGHGGGDHGPNRNEGDKAEAQGRGVNTSSGRHQH
ncbi:MAG: hypothetical protein WA140_10810 [Geobacteraceae bacterium]